VSGGDGLATSDTSGRRRETWSLKTLVEEIAGRPMTELQEPGRPVHPYLQMKLAHANAPGAHPEGSRHSARPGHPDDGTEERRAEAADLPPDPVDRVFPPLIGPTGRALHGQEAEHHTETLERHHSDAAAPTPGTRPHAPGPSRRPERIYLHYLLLHLDRLSDPALRYLKLAVDEEVDHRSSS
jgi:hypothetical protein